MAAIRDFDARPDRCSWHPFACLRTERFAAADSLALYGARTLSRYEAPQPYEIVGVLAARAGLANAPELYYVRSGMISAFTVGSVEMAMIAVTEGLLQQLNSREIQGVLAHEVAHVQHNDLHVMGLADLVSHLTVALSWTGQLLLVLNLPLILASDYEISWALILMLIFAPGLTSLLQLGLSRTREFDADLGAARLTGDPMGLASALAKLERLQEGLLERVLFPGRQVPEPSLLRTHPATEERIRKLVELRREFSAPGVPGEAVPQLDDGFGMAGPGLRVVRSRDGIRQGYGTSGD